ncbi:hypothetical protein GCM10027280_24460 [Micromonospora polyrhachis]|uniref:Uncharacterized protein n=1 Tax=Micromonospora polyrhachis TaxID=1282883 RepID=A0A7W7ST18_9ACTN|nr:hypothetical protein [Micromonospora polyrhachis]MBB4960460.1 hypothetical protein [Micromonospora polyrhachis]
MIGDDRLGRNQPAERLPVLGQPDGDADPIGDPDFAEEHCRTAVADDIITGMDRDREPESPRGWSGLER